MYEALFLNPMKSSFLLSSCNVYVSHMNHRIFTIIDWVTVTVSTVLCLHLITEMFTGKVSAIFFTQQAFIFEVVVFGLSAF